MQCPSFPSSAIAAGKSSPHLPFRYFSLNIFDNFFIRGAGFARLNTRMISTQASWFWEEDDTKASISTFNSSSSCRLDFLIDTISAVIALITAAICSYQTNYIH